MRIIEAKPDDLPAILALQKLAYLSEAELLNDYSILPLIQTLADLETEFQNKTILKAVNENDGELTGSIRGYVEGGTLFVGKLMVHPDCQNQGLGAKLLRTLENLFPKMRYELFTSNKSLKNIALYTKNGYSEFKREKIANNLELIFLHKTSE